MATAAQVDILLKTRADLAGMQQFKSGLQSLTVGLGSVRNLLAGLGVGVSVGGLVAVARSSLELAGNIKDLAAQANISADALQVLGAAGLASGVKLEDLRLVLTTMQRSIQEAVGGNAALSQSFQSLGLNAFGLKALAPERQIELIAKSVLNAKDQTAAWNAAMEILGTKNAPKLRATLEALARDGFDKISEATKNLRISDADLDTLDKAGDKLDEIITRMKVIAAQGVVKVAAAVESGKEFGAVNESTDSPALSKYRAARKAENDLLQQRIRRQIGEANESKRGGEFTDRAARTAELEERAQENKRQAEEIQRQAEYAKAVGEARDKAEAEAAEKSFQAEIVENQKSRDRRIRLSAENRADAERLAKEEAEAVAQARRLASAQADQALGNGIATVDLERQRIEANAYITKEEKQRRLIPLFQKENDLIAKRIELLEIELAKSPDDAARQAAQARIDGLRQRQGQNTVAAESAAPKSFSQQLVADLTVMEERFGTATQAISSFLTNGVGTAIQGVSDGIYGMITRTQTWGQVWLTVGSSILKSLIDMGVQQAILFAKGLFFTKANATAQAQAGAQIAASNAPAAAATSVASYGSAAVVGAAAAGLAIGAIIAMLTSGGFAEGGLVTGPGTGTSDSIPAWLSNGEYVMPAATVERLGVAEMRRIHHGTGYASGGLVTTGASTSSRAAAPASAAGRTPTIVVVGDEEEMRRYMLNSGEFDARVQYVNNRNRRY